MISPADLKTLITRVYMETGEDQTVPDLAKRAGVNANTIRQTLDACHGVPEGCQFRTMVYNVRAVNEYGPTLETLREMLLAAGYQFASADGSAP